MHEDPTARALVGTVSAKRQLMETELRAGTQGQDLDAWIPSRPAVIPPGRIDTSGYRSMPTDRQIFANVSIGGDTSRTHRHKWISIDAYR
jgi:hypothetical protein